MPIRGLNHFMHGKESGAGGSKITALAGVARVRGWDVASLDYSHTVNPVARLAQLLQACAEMRGPLLLVGSSMGLGRSAGSSACQSTWFVLDSARAVYAGLSQPGT